MRAVNLLPEKHRPRQPTGSRQGSSYFVLGGLALLCLGVLVYVLTLNSINSARSDVTNAKAETQRLQAQAQQLGPYGDFAKVKAQRVSAVRQLAEGRFDWERLVRELAHVLPSGVWISQAGAADSAQDAATLASTSGTGSSDSSTTTSDSPVLTLQGCATSQSQVAVTLVRLRELQGATDVSLAHSTRGDGNSTTAGGSGGSGGTGGTPGQCGLTHGQPDYSFQVTVTFAKQPATADRPGTVPTSLGGGQ